MFDVAVIGTGVVGGLIARELTKYELSVCLIEKENDVAMGATKANSAIVHAGFDAECGTLKAKYVINAAGANSGEIARLAGDESFSVNARKGEYLLLDSECGNLCKTTIFRTPTKMGKGILISPTVDGNIILGPTALDTGNKEEKKVTQKGLNDIMRNASECVTKIPFNKAITSFAGLRAVGNTGDFIIGASKDISGLINVAGIESPGLTASPAIAQYIVEILGSIGLSLKKKAAFNSCRKPYDFFKHLTVEEKNELIKKDSSFGRIVCRCEKVMEGEILSAIRQNPKPLDIDGVKRRTRSGMGRCHGGFCGPGVQELIAKELSINYDEVTKSGGNSKLIFEKIR